MYNAQTRYTISGRDGFDKEVAVHLGISAALVLEKMFLDASNIAGAYESEEYEDSDPAHWAINDDELLRSQMPYLKPDQISEALELLVNAGYLIRRQFPNPLDNTKIETSYFLTPLGLQFYLIKPELNLVKVQSNSSTAISLFD